MDAIALALRTETVIVSPVSSFNPAEEFKLTNVDPKDEKSGLLMLKNKTSNLDHVVKIFMTSTFNDMIVGAASTTISTKETMTIKRKPYEKEHTWFRRVFSRHQPKKLFTVDEMLAIIRQELPIPAKHSKVFAIPKHNYNWVQNIFFVEAGKNTTYAVEVTWGNMFGCYLLDAHPLLTNDGRKNIDNAYVVFEKK